MLECSAVAFEDIIQTLKQIQELIQEKPSIETYLNELRLHPAAVTPRSSTTCSELKLDLISIIPVEAITAISPQSSATRSQSDQVSITAGISPVETLAAAPPQSAASSAIMHWDDEHHGLVARW
jgi:hypothetical protein